MKDQLMVLLRAVCIVVMLVSAPIAYFGASMRDNHAKERPAAWAAYRDAECTPAGFTAVVERGGGKGQTTRTPGETAPMVSCPKLGPNPVIDLAGGPRPFWEVETSIADAALCRARAKAYPWAGPCSD